MARTQNGAYDEALAGMASNNPNRQPMGTSALENTSYPSAKPGGTPVARKNTAAGDPAAQPMARPTGRQLPPGGERMGAAYGIKVNYTSQTSPEAGATQANGRVFKSAVMRDRYNFNDGNATSY